ncbi:hypothetical protein HK102_012077, partial [Quaeritorhiza haematococci]
GITATINIGGELVQARVDRGEEHLHNGPVHDTGRVCVFHNITKVPGPKFYIGHLDPIPFDILDYDLEMLEKLVPRPLVPVLGNLGFTFDL